MAREGSKGEILGARRGRKIVVGMSGGVDSTVSLLLLKRQGWSPVGVSLLFPSWKGDCSGKRENDCCQLESIANASKVCAALGLPHHVYDCRKRFKKEVVDYFTSELACGRTPNPCSFCNWKVKFQKLLEWADKHKIRHVATGHYAAIEWPKGRAQAANRGECGQAPSNAAGGHLLLVRPKDVAKDQTYGLCLLPKKWLSRIIFPLAQCTKQEVYGIAKKKGFDFYLKVPQSQDLCFVSGGQMRGFLFERLGERRGPIIDWETGKEIGRHGGIFNFTIGQRRGLRFPHRYFVKEFDLGRNAVFVTRDRCKLLRRGMIVGNLNYVSGIPIRKRERVRIQIHPHQRGLAATAVPRGKRELEILLDAPLEGIAPGQICAIYKSITCLGGGTIEKAL